MMYVLYGIATNGFQLAKNIVTGIEQRVRRAGEGPVRRIGYLMGA